MFGQHREETKQRSGGIREREYASYSPPNRLLYHKRHHLYKSRAATSLSVDYERSSFIGTGHRLKERPQSTRTRSRDVRTERILGGGRQSPLRHQLRRQKFRPIGPDRLQHDDPT